MKLGSYPGGLCDYREVEMEISRWYYTDLPPLYKYDKRGDLQEYDFMLKQLPDRTYVIKGTIEQPMKKTRTFESAAKRVSSKDNMLAAIEQIQSKWNKKRDKDGWMEDIDAPPAIQEPMLVHRWDKAKKREGPWLVGTKLDGLCTFWRPEDAQFYSRKRSIFTVPAVANHMYGEFEKIGAHGELYTHGCTWEEISGAVSRGRDAELDSSGDLITLQNSEVEFHMFDRHDMPKEGYLNRLESLLDLQIDSHLIHVVPSVYCTTEEEVAAAFEGFLKLDFEGAVANKLDGIYSWDTRSWDRLKIKPTFSDEFELHSICFDNNAKHGKMIAYNVKAKNGKIFKVTPSSSQEKRAADYERLRMHPIVPGMWMTVDYGDVYASGIPKFGVAKGFRDDIIMGD